MANQEEVIKTSKKTEMDPEAAKRIQSKADKTGKNQDFKVRAQRAATKKKKEG